MEAALLCESDDIEGQTKDCGEKTDKEGKRDHGKARMRGGRERICGFRDWARVGRKQPNFEFLFWFFLPAFSVFSPESFERDGLC